MKKTYFISNSYITLEDIFKYFNSDFYIRLDDSAKAAVKKNRAYLEAKLSDSTKSIYGINTGFGSLCDVRISDEDIESLQEKLILSHACGTGDLVPEFLAKFILLLKIKNLSMGFSGVRPELIQTMVDHYNAGIIPVIYQLGSLGASGDLAPLAHMSLPYLGYGEVYLYNKIEQSQKALDAQGLDPISLKAKEGLALINGTQFSLAYGLHGVYHAQRLIKIANLVFALSMEAYNAMLQPFSPLLHNIRKQKGQIKVAQQIRSFVEGSKNLKREKYNVQDPYSFRCTPQVHGATLDTIDHVSGVMELELNAVTDNPNVFSEEDEILSGGNFHAQPLALAMDFLSIALSELANISERRIYKLINGERELPAFLTKTAGLNSGFMIVQYTAAAVVNKIKHLANPVSTDSIVSSMGQEDHVSMAANAGTKLYQLAEHIYRVLAMELLSAAQAIEFRDANELAPNTALMYNGFREKVSALEEDRAMYPDMDAAFDYLLRLDLSKF